MAKGIKRLNKKREALLYALFCSIPLAVRQYSAKELSKTSYTLNNEEIDHILKCRTKSQFSQIFGISRKQLNKWDNSELLKQMVEKLSKQNNVLQYKHDIDYAFTQQTVKTADPVRVKLWKEVYEGWRPGIDLSAKFLPFQIVVRKMKNSP